MVSLFCKMLKMWGEENALFALPCGPCMHNTHLFCQYQDPNSSSSKSSLKSGLHKPEDSIVRF